MYAVLLHADSASSLEEIDAAVRQQIAEYMLRMRRFQLEAYRRLEPVHAAIEAVVELLVKKDYETLELAAMTPERRVDLSRAVDEYGRTLVAPEASWWPTVTLTLVNEDAGGGLHVAASLWTAEEGRSDLSLEAWLTPDEHGRHRIQILDLHVL